jgi:ETC complex I subunit conserved region
MAARLFQRSKNAMQSGRARSDEWILQFESHRRKRPDPLTGWSGGADTQEQVTIAFPDLDAAKRYAEKYGIDYHIVPPAERKMRIQSYADNFK